MGLPKVKGWGDYSVPESTDTLLALINKVKEIRSTKFKKSDQQSERNQVKLVTIQTAAACLDVFLINLSFNSRLIFCFSAGRAVLRY